jgi:hypothetical protein
MLKLYYVKQSFSLLKVAFVFDLFSIFKINVSEKIYEHNGGAYFVLLEKYFVKFLRWCYDDVNLWEITYIL